MIERTSPKVSKLQVTIDSTPLIRMTFERSSDSCGSYVLLGRKDKMDNEKYRALQTGNRAFRWGFYVYNCRNLNNLKYTFHVISLEYTREN